MAVLSTKSFKRVIDVMLVSLLMLTGTGASSGQSRNEVSTAKLKQAHAMLSNAISQKGIYQLAHTAFSIAQAKPILEVSSNALSGHESLTQDRVDEIERAVLDAHQNLVSVRYLEHFYLVYSTAGFPEEYYTPEAWKRLQLALESAKDILNDALDPAIHIHQDTVDAARQELIDAVMDATPLF